MIRSIAEFERWNGGCPGNYEYAALENLTPDEDNPALEVFFAAAKHVVSNWHVGKFAGLYIYGTPGTGKTHAALALGRELHEESDAEIYYRFGPDTKDYAPSQWRGRRVVLNPRDNINSVFPSHISESLNISKPPSVLIFDDYKPELQQQLYVATEAAAQYGGLMIVTSNDTDPFSLVDLQIPERTMADTAIDIHDPDGAESRDLMRTERAMSISDSLRSRVASGFKFINFTGRDRRLERSFWQ